ncbi:MAG: polysaccharide biosynthesis/export family protein [Nibricoccus sp.]
MISFIRSASARAKIHSRGILFSLLLAIGLGGCAQISSNAPAPAPARDSHATESLALNEGDVLRVSFPGTPALDTVQTIRRDGRIVLPLVGEVQASGYTPSEFNAQLTKLYAPQLINKEVVVSLVSSSFTVFVSGAVLRPGKVVSDRPLTALEAIMEAGGFDSAKANMKAIVVIREGQPLREKIDLKRVLDGKNDTPFYLKPRDIIHVPDRLVVF